MDDCLKGDSSQSSVPADRKETNVHCVPERMMVKMGGGMPQCLDIVLVALVLSVARNRRLS